jgi:hypothetical protein
MLIPDNGLQFWKTDHKCRDHSLCGEDCKNTFTMDDALIVDRFKEGPIEFYCNRCFVEQVRKAPAK